MKSLVLIFCLFILIRWRIKGVHSFLNLPSTVTVTTGETQINFNAKDRFLTKNILKLSQKNLNNFAETDIQEDINVGKGIWSLVSSMVDKKDASYQAIDKLEEFDIVEFQVLVFNKKLLRKEKDKKIERMMNKKIEVKSDLTAERKACVEEEKNSMIDGNDLLNQWYGIGVCLSLNNFQQQDSQKQDTGNTKLRESLHEEERQELNGKQLLKWVNKMQVLPDLQLHPLSRRHYEVEDVRKEDENEEVELFYDEEGSNPFVIYHQSSRGCSGEREEKEEEKEPDQIKFYGKDNNRQTLVHFTRKLNQEDIYLQQRCIEDRLLNPHGEEAEDVFIINTVSLSEKLFPITSRFVQL